MEAVSKWIVKACGEVEETGEHDYTVARGNSGDMLLLCKERKLESMEIKKVISC